MSRNPFPTTQMQNLWKEAIEKEAQARLNAFARLKGKPRTKSNQHEVYSKRRELNKQALFDVLPPLVTEKRYGYIDPRLLPPPGEDFYFSRLNEASDENLFARPVSPLVRDTLYEGYSRIGQGRKIYLKQRNDKNPEDKFRFPVCSSWDYGWRLGDVIRTEDIVKPEFAQYMIMERTFYSKNGLGFQKDGCTGFH
ncbi:protein ATP6V1FNB-like [Physella acuta]|uniref:protein ATP6V1FNB-like n=1 Tax=Physella acuta TaxID=109671 RepID=UPI0027DB6E30|nr:protein ATP6V1FNB-like [Physella acuta]